MSYTKQQLKNFTLSSSLFPHTSLTEAVEKLTFIQIDPIRSPARAQDLILRHRVKEYHVGDIDREYSTLNLEEDFLYAHGYMTQNIWKLLHPRENIDLTDFDKKVLTVVREEQKFTSKDLESHFGTIREQTWWGGMGRATNLALQRLHYYGLIRVVGRKNGNRIYQTLPVIANSLTTDERLKKIILAMIHIMEPVSSKTLSQSFHRIHRHFGNTREMIQKLIKEGMIQTETVDGVTYVWTGKREEKEIPTEVKFLCPFDPVVRDRVRFEHLWGWLYQFEAYVPMAKRIRGYYAMPILWGVDMVGWANIKVVSKELTVDLGFTTTRPKSKQFEQQIEEEITRMKEFLKKKRDN